jgi:hypothetical protein
LVGVLGWHSFIARRECALAREGASVKFAQAASVGLEYLEPATGAGALPQVIGHARSALADSATYFAASPRCSFRRQGSMLLFDSPSATGGENGIARAVIHESGSARRAAVLLPYWNAAREDCRPFGALLAHCGVTCVQLSLPYHDERRTAGTAFARELACENLGLTICANRQAVQDARACVSYLESQGYQRIAVVGVSLGASIASIVAALDERVGAAVLLLMADDFSDVVWTGSATRHVRASLEQSFSRADVRAAWSVISPASHAARLSARLSSLLIVSGDLDTVFLPALTRAYVERLQRHGLDPTWVRYACGHYTLANPFYAMRCFARTVFHLRAKL